MGTNYLNKEQLAEERAKGNVVTMKDFREQLEKAEDWEIEVGREGGRGREAGGGGAEERRAKKGGEKGCLRNKGIDFREQLEKAEDWEIEVKGGMVGGMEEKKGQKKRGRKGVLGTRGLSSGSSWRRQRTER